MRKRYMVIAEIPEPMRRWILEFRPPLYEKVYAKVLTLCYDVPKHKEFPRKVRATVYAYHRTKNIESLMCEVNPAHLIGRNEVVRSDGVPFRICISAKNEIQPAEAGFIDVDKIQYLDSQYGFDLEPKMVPVHIIPWDKNPRFNREKLTVDHMRGRKRPRDEAVPEAPETPPF